jgi:hypothetical protein
MGNTHFNDSVRSEFIETVFSVSNFSLLRSQQTRNRFEDGGLPRPVGTHETDDLVFLYGEFDFSDGDHIRIVNLQPANV